MDPQQASSLPSKCLPIFDSHAHTRPASGGEEMWGNKCGERQTSSRWSQPGTPWSSRRVAELLLAQLLTAEPSCSLQTVQDLVCEAVVASWQPIDEPPTELDSCRNIESNAHDMRSPCTINLLTAMEWPI